MGYEKVSRIAVRKLISELKDDLGRINLKNDLTSKTLLPNSLIGRAIITNREKIILCGQSFLKDFLKQKFPMLAFKSKYSDGNELYKNSIILEINGNVKFILLIERTILNFVQHLSSISTYTRKFVKKIGGTKTKLLDTRKTTTGLRVLEKYENRVLIKGSVYRPGIFSIPEDGMTVKELIDKAEGTKTDVYFNKAYITRTNSDYSTTNISFNLRDEKRR